MRKFFTLALCMVVMQMVASDLPELYLRGEVNGWACVEDYHFSHDNEGNYSLTCPKLEGKFKIADANWTPNGNFGRAWDREGKVENNSWVYMDSAADDQAGDNWEAATTMQNVTIKFTYKSGADLWMSVGEPDYPIPSTNTQLSGTLPVLYINVYTDETMTVYNNEINSKDLAHKDYFSFANYWLDCSACDWMKGAKNIGSEEEPLALEIKARGNWTRIGYSKKPFKLKLGKKQSMLGMTKSKHYAILAHADDTWGYMRNFTGFNLGRRMGLPWTPDQQPIEVVVNGDYRGLYFLTESIRVGDDRVMIEELADNETNASLCSGGYLVELDNYDEENQIRLDEKFCDDAAFHDVLRITWDTPEVYSDVMKRFVKEQFETMNDYVGSKNDALWQYMDLDDAARYYVVEEIISHVESFHGSTYMFRDRGEGQKWHFSPLWDCGNGFNGPSDRFLYENGVSPFGNTWIGSLRCNDTFNAKVKETWKWFMSNCYDGIEDEMKAYAEHLKAAAKADHNRWNGEPTPNNGVPVCDNRNMDEKLNNVINKLHDKINWLKGQFGDYTNGTYSEPARDNTPAAALPEYVKMPITDGVSEVMVEEGVAPVYYDLTGMRISNPTRGSIIIERRGAETRKVLVK